MDISSGYIYAISIKKEAKQHNFENVKIFIQ